MGATSASTLIRSEHRSRSGHHWTVEGPVTVSWTVTGQGQVLIGTLTDRAAVWPSYNWPHSIWGTGATGFVYFGPGFTLPAAQDRLPDYAATWAAVRAEADAAAGPLPAQDSAPRRLTAADTPRAGP
ncbi:hypothetical protein [Nocardia wallacei]|uniref:hypothetical protein n=1 Tax=Nocardia wallacei TaxID=480035 RepID=UPI002454FCE8|nr:hypothetical protein [Nocardia wallacei]